MIDDEEVLLDVYPIKIITKNTITRANSTKKHSIYFFRSLSNSSYFRMNLCNLSVDAFESPFTSFNSMESARMDLAVILH